jgi:putative transposase
VFRKGSNGTYRNEFLNRYIFESLDEIRDITDDWLIEYNYKRPHSSLGGLPPKVFLDQQQNIANL